ncbi:hypothetical protein R1flu_012813 [Riccia fluitans]|uniref:S-protein homolog n=1 Tax=Riccia fluitans TaxID=41844 RepID=A0ABD1ZC04_9MARC
MMVAPALVLAVLGIITACEHGSRALAQTSSSLIEAGLNEIFSVECYALAENDTMQKNYGIWEMEVHQLQTLQLSIVNSNTTKINCHFVWTSSGNTSTTLHQDFDVYLASGLAFDCSGICHWTVFSDGFYLFNPATSADSFISLPVLRSVSTALINFKGHKPANIDSFSFSIDSYD